MKKEKSSWVNDDRMVNTTNKFNIETKKNLIRMIYREDIDDKQVMERLSIDQKQLQFLVEELVHEGFLRLSSEDNQEIELELTDKGKKLSEERNKLSNQNLRNIRIHADKIQCQRCGKKYEKNQIETCPTYMFDWSNKKLCKKCFKEIQTIETKNYETGKSDYKTIPKNHKVDTNHLQKKLQNDNQNVSTDINRSIIDDSYQINEYKKRNSYKKNMILPIIFSIVVICILFFSLFLPWYIIDMTQDGEAISQDEHVYLTSQSSSEYLLTEGKMVHKYCVDSGEVKDTQTETDNLEYRVGEIKNTMNVTLFLMVINIILAILTLIILIGTAIGKFNKKTSITVFSILTVVIFISLAFFTISFPNSYTDEMHKKIKRSNDSYINYLSEDFKSEYNRNFFDSVSIDLPASRFPQMPKGTSGTCYIDCSLGGGLSWYLMVCTFIISTIGLGTTVNKKKKRVDNNLKKQL